jgi:EAL domain-containing protein (putative c-di-GMP-specific phosphodiesterase class I)
MLAEAEANVAILHQLRELGVSISMDDFGTGAISEAFRSTRSRSIVRS